MAQNECGKIKWRENGGNPTKMKDDCSEKNARSLKYICKVQHKNTKTKKYKNGIGHRSKRIGPPKCNAVLKPKNYARSKRGGGQSGGGTTDNLFLYKKNMAQHPWLNNVINLERIIQGEEQIENCIELDNTEGKINKKILDTFNSENPEVKIPILPQMFTGGKRKTRRKRNKSNKKKKKKIQIKNKSKKNRKKSKNKTRKR